ncbi:unnamed protein product, partial [marine sediment metagenome]
KRIKDRLDNVYKPRSSRDSNYEMINDSAENLDKYLSPNTIDSPAANSGTRGNGYCSYRR